MSGKAIRETLAALGVIASMVFVGLEIRQNTAVARGATRQAVTDSQLGFLMTMATDTSLMDSYYSEFQPENPNPASKLRAYWAMLANLTMLENVFLQELEGVADESVFASYGWGGREPFQTPEFLAWWSNDTRFHPDFVAAFEAEYGLEPIP